MPEKIFSRRAAAAGIAAALGCGGFPGRAGATAMLKGPLPARDGAFQVWDVAPIGYVAEEFLLTGIADIRDAVTMADAADMSKRDNVRDLARQADYHSPLRQTGVTYTTRLTVYRPRNAARFSGNVIVEITHPEGGGAQLVWAGQSGFFAQKADAYVAIQHPLNFAGLRAADSGRYGALDVKDATQLWGMVRDTAQLLKAGASALLPGFAVRHLYLTGYSYTGVATATFANYHHNDARLPGGQPLFSGYMPLANATYVRPLDVPVLRINTQSDFNSFGGIANRSWDSDAAPGRYRLYEVAGASHANASPKVEPAAQAPKPRETPRQQGLPAFSAEGCMRSFPAGSGPNTMPLNYVIARAFENLYAWVDGGKAPPHAPLIQVDGKGNPALDADGNAQGGLRLPEITVPAASYGTGSGDCFLFGYRLPFDTAKLAQRYGDRAAYLRASARAADQMVAEDLLRPTDAEAIRREAQTVRF